MSEPDSARYGQEPCADHGCSSTLGVKCEYVDRRRRPCPTAWCAQHQYIVGGKAYCRRHAGVVVAMLNLPEDEREYPDLDNRAPSLLEFLARRLHQGAVQILQAQGAQYPGSQIIADALHMTMAGTPRVRGWEHRWRLLDHTGPLATIGIRIDEETDSLVQVKVDGHIVQQSTPEWITNRDDLGGDDEARRAAFDQQLLTTMWESLETRGRTSY